VVENARPYEAIIAAAVEKGCDLIAMASHGRRGVSAIVLGSETLKVLTHSMPHRLSSSLGPPVEQLARFTTKFADALLLDPVGDHASQQVA
jgi:hypothetical protein